MRYEYRSIKVDHDSEADVDYLNEYAGAGWRVVHVTDGGRVGVVYMWMERCTDPVTRKVV